MTLISPRQTSLRIFTTDWKINSAMFVTQQDNVEVVAPNDQSSVSLLVPRSLKTVRFAVK